MIEIRNMSHSLGEKLVLNGISLSIPENTIVGLIGINGAGKSTLLRLMAGVYLPDGGEILYDGVPPSDERAREDIFFLPDDPYFATHTTPHSLFNYYKTFYPNIDKEVFSSLISQYEINENDLIRNFSKGMRRQVFIAIALAVKPKYLLLDEAFDGLDPLSRRIFKSSIISFVENEGTSVVIASHSLRELEDFCDKFVLIDKNTVKSQGDISEHVGGMCKFDVAFAEPIDEKIFDGLPIISKTVRGKFAQLAFSGKREDILPLIEALSPLLIDEIPLDFEDSFIYDVEKKGDKK